MSETTWGEVYELVAFNRLAVGLSGEPWAWLNPGCSKARCIGRGISFSMGHDEDAVRLGFALAAGVA